MSEQLYDFFGEIFQRYFRPAIDTYPRTGAALVERLFTLSDDVPDRLTQTRCAATAWAKAETPNARISSELFVITQHGLIVVVDSRFGRDLASAHPMDAALRRILDEHLALRVNLPA